MKTEELAETFAKEQLIELENGLYLVHSAAVKFVSLILAESEDVDSEVLTVASWLHNIDRVKGNDNQEVLAFESAKHLFQNLSSDAYYVLSDCILNHRSAEKPETKEGQILHDADKIAFLHPTYLDFIKAEFEREKTPEKFATFVADRLKARSELVLEKSKELFDDYSLLAKDMFNS